MCYVVALERSLFSRSFSYERSCTEDFIALLRGASLQIFVWSKLKYIIPIIFKKRT